MRSSAWPWVHAMLVGLAALLLPTHADAQQRCDIPREARDIWHCENGFVIGPENVIIRLPIPETDPEALYNAGVEAAQREDWRVAIAYFTAAQQRAHLVPRYMYNLGLAHARAGHHVAAMAWLAAYLAADPNAPNRAAVWSQIDQSEARARQQLQSIERAASQAAQALPSTLQPGRAEALASLAQSRNAAQQLAGEELNAWALTLRGRSHFAPLFSSSVYGLIQPYAGPGLPAFLQLGWVQGGRTGSVSGSPTDFDRALQAARTNSYWQTDRDGGLALDLAVANRGRDAVEAAAWVNEGDVTFSTSIENVPAVPITTPPPPHTSYREAVAAQVAEILLYRGDTANAESAVRLAEQFAATSPSPVSGWAAARARGLLLAERGQLDDAVDSLAAYLTRRSLSGDTRDAYGSISPTQYWTGVRFDAIGCIVEYLYFRGRIDDAVAFSSRLDSYRQAIFYQKGLQGSGFRDSRWQDLYNAALARAAGGAVPPRADQIMQALRAAIELEPPGYDANWWTEHVVAHQQRTDPYQRFQAIEHAAETLTMSLQRIRMAYERAGGTWRDTPVTAASPN